VIHPMMNDATIDSAPRSERRIEFRFDQFTTGRGRLQPALIEHDYVIVNTSTDQSLLFISNRISSLQNSTHRSRFSNPRSPLSERPRSRRAARYTRAGIHSTLTVIDSSRSMLGIITIATIEPNRRTSLYDGAFSVRRDRL